MYGLTFLTAPEDEGQVIDVSYAACGDRIFSRSYDRSDGSTTYSVAPILSRDWRWYETWVACNGAPPIPNSRWRKISESEVMRIARAFFDC